jgi:hypothetical protein
MSAPNWNNSRRPETWSPVNLPREKETRMPASCCGNRRLPAWVQLFAVLLVSASSSGCLNYLMAVAYFIGGPPTVEPDFDVVTHKSMTDKDVTVAVVCFAPDNVKYEFDNIDRDIAKYVTYRLHAKHVKVINPDVIRDWLDKHNDWDKPEEIGVALGVTYVIFIDLHSYTLFAEHSVNLFQGRSECMVSVVEMDEDETGERIYNKEIISKYPLAAPRPTTETEYDTFKKEYLSRLSDEIGRLFYEYENMEDISAAI